MLKAVLAFRIFWPTRVNKINFTISMISICKANHAQWLKAKNHEIKLPKKYWKKKEEETPKPKKKERKPIGCTYYIHVQPTRGKHVSIFQTLFNGCRCGILQLGFKDQKLKLIAV